MSNTNDTIVSLNDRMKKLQEAKEKRKVFEEEPNYKDLYEEAIDIFNTHARQGDGFIAFVFSNDGSSSCLHGGELDLIQLLGTMRFTENELLQNTFYYMEPTFDDPEE